MLQRRPVNLRSTAVDRGTVFHLPRASFDLPWVTKHQGKSLIGERVCRSTDVGPCLTETLPEGVFDVARTGVQVLIGFDGWGEEYDYSCKITDGPLPRPLFLLYQPLFPLFYEPRIFSFFVNLLKSV